MTQIKFYWSKLNVNPSVSINKPAQASLQFLLIVIFTQDGGGGGGAECMI